MKVNGIELLQMIKDGKVNDKTMIKSQRNELTSVDEYYIFNSYESKFHRCDKNGKLGAKGSTRFMNYETLYKDFEIIEPTEEIEESKKLKNLELCSYEDFKYMNSKQRYHVTAQEYHLLNQLAEVVNELRNE